MLAHLHRLPRPRARTLVLATLTLAVLAFAALGATPAGAQGNSGTIKVLDEPGENPPNQNEPHVGCDDFWVEGMKMAAGEGTLNVFSWPPTGNKELVLTDSWTADGDGHFLAGPYTLPEGHYKVQSTNSDKGGEKSKVFWVECAGSNPTPTGTTSESPSESSSESPSDTSSPTESPSGTSTATATNPPPSNGIPCPQDVSARANGDESVTLTWTPVDGSDGTNVYRAQGGGGLAYVTTVGPGVGTYTDTDTVAGNGYAYALTTLDGDRESSACPVAEVTAVPELPTVAAVGLATALGAAGYALVAWRRKA